MKNKEVTGVHPTQILLPNDSTNLTKWAVVACDQYTSQPEYWEEVLDFINDEPSTYHLILPEVYLGKEKELVHSKRIPGKMAEYLNTGLFEEHPGMIYVKRTFNGKSRRGLIAAIDLEQYDFRPGAKTIIRATEGTIIDRLPPRVKIRKEALLEIPHIMVLVDDPQDTLMSYLEMNTKSQNQLYDFELMQNGGHIQGFLFDESLHLEKIQVVLSDLARPEIQKKKYGIESGDFPLILAVGDGNHSLATAKAVWESIKDSFAQNHPARYAMVEIVNLHDPGLEFEAIHRLLVGFDHNLSDEIENIFGDIQVQEHSSFNAMKEKVLDESKTTQTAGVFNEDTYLSVKIIHLTHTLAVGSIQSKIDKLEQSQNILSIDYIHGDDTIHTLGVVKDNIGIFLPCISKFDLFKSVLHDGALPRKTFSMGEASQKRFYLECRKIKE